FGVATTKPAGRVSEKEIPVRGNVFPAGAVMVKVSDVEPAVRTLGAPNAVTRAGGAATIRVAAAVLPVPPLVEFTAPVVLVKLPAAVPVTVTLKVQAPPTAMLAPVKAIVLLPLVVSVPPQVLVDPLATVTFAGKLRVKATPVKAIVLAA